MSYTPADQSIGNETVLRNSLTRINGGIAGRRTVTLCLGRLVRPAGTKGMNDRMAHIRGSMILLPYQQKNIVEWSLNVDRI